MKRVFPLLLVALVVLVFAPPADASWILDPGAAALGTASTLSPLFNGLMLAKSTADAQVTASSGGSPSSDLYLVYRDQRPSLPAGIDPGGEVVEPLLPSPESGAPGWTPVDLNSYDSSGPGLDDLDGEWLALDLSRGRRPGVTTPTGGQQPETPATPAPEPAGVMLLAIGLAVMGTMRLLRNRPVRIFA